eukprot:PITA_33718
MIEFVEAEPSSFEEAIEKPVWVDAMVEEYESIVKKNVWVVVPRPANKSLVGSRQIFKVKHASDGSIEKYKVIFVAKGYSKVEGTDYEETFSPIARLKRALYGLKQEPRAWYTRINSYLIGLGFIKVDQILQGGPCKGILNGGHGSHALFLGLAVWKVDGELFVSQGKYANEILHKFHMESCKPMETPLTTKWRMEDATLGEEANTTIYRQLVVSLMYLVNT